MIFTTPETAASFLENLEFDEFYDHYVEPATKPSLKYSLSKSALKNSSASTEDGIKNRDSKIYEKIAELEDVSFLHLKDTVSTIFIGATSMASLS